MGARGVRSATSQMRLSPSSAYCLEELMERPTMSGATSRFPFWSLRKHFADCSPREDVASNGAIESREIHTFPVNSRRGTSIFQRCAHWAGSQRSMFVKDFAEPSQAIFRWMEG